MKNFGISILIKVVLFYCASSFSQTGNSSLYRSFDTIVTPQNTGLANGVEYIEQHIIRNNKHKYFSSPKYIKGSVVYDQQPYHNVDLKYNIFDDLLLVKIKTAGGSAAFQLYKEKVSSFEIAGHRFISMKQDGMDHFVEVLLEEGQFYLLKKHLKKERKHLSKSFTYFEFEADSPEYLIYINDTSHEVNSRSAILKLFPGQEKEIRSFYRHHSPLKKSDPDTFLTLLFKGLISSNSK